MSNLWVHDTQSVAFRMNVFEDLQARGGDDILTVCNDNLTSLTEGILSFFSHDQNQISRVDQIRKQPNM